MCVCVCVCVCVRACVRACVRVSVQSAQRLDAQQLAHLTLVTLPGPVRLLRLLLSLQHAQPPLLSWSTPVASLPARSAPATGISLPSGALAMLLRRPCANMMLLRCSCALAALSCRAAAVSITALVTAVITALVTALITALITAVVRHAGREMQAEKLVDGFILLLRQVAPRWRPR